MRCDMPDEFGRLSDEEQRKALAWIKGRLKVTTCPMCGDEDITLSDSVNAVPMMGKGTILPNVFTPTLLIICDNCGHMRTFSAVRAGVVAKGPPPPPRN
jgi:hypothetical protein